MTNSNTSKEIDKILDLAGFQIFPAGANKSREQAKVALQELLVKAVDRALKGQPKVAFWSNPNLVTVNNILYIRKTQVTKANSIQEDK